MLRQHYKVSIVSNPIIHTRKCKSVLETFEIVYFATNIWPMSHKMAWGVSFEYYLLFVFLEMPGLKMRIRRISPTWVVVVFLIKRKKNIDSLFTWKDQDSLGTIKVGSCL